MDWYEEGEHNRGLEFPKGDPKQLMAWIREGEHQEQDFKFRIDSSLKIARSLSAFANTDGGRLLIGVKDNGKITGIDPQEEYYMIEGAAEVYSHPRIPFEYELYDVDNALVLVIHIHPSNQRPHFVKETTTQKIAYIRREDQNLATNRVLLRYLRDKSPKNSQKNLVAYSDAERFLFEYLSANDYISVSKFVKKAQIHRNKAERILASFLKWGLLDFESTEGGIRFKLKPDPLD